VYAASNDKLTFSLSSTWTFASAWVYNTRNTFNTKNMSSVVREMMHFLKNAFRSPNFKNCQMEKKMRSASIHSTRPLFMHSKMKFEMNPRCSLALIMQRFILKKCYAAGEKQYETAQM